MQIIKTSNNSITYLDIGHGKNGKKYQAWVWEDGTIKTTPIIDPKKEKYQSHTSVWGYKGSNFLGRYEPETGRLSIVLPEDRFEDKIPNIILSHLYSYFPKIKKIYIFDSNAIRSNPQIITVSKYKTWYKKAQEAQKAQKEQKENKPLSDKDFFIAGREVFTVDGLDYMAPRSPYKMNLYEIDTKIIDERWQNNLEEYYFKPGYKDLRNLQFMEWMKYNIPIEAPEIYIDKNGSIMFVDGRHRFTTIRDMGKTKIVVAAYPEQDQLLKLIGAKKLN